MSLTLDTAEDVILAIGKMPEHEFREVLHWVANIEAPRRVAEEKERKERRHVKHIKSFRKGHRLRLNRDVWSNGDIVMGRGDVVKLVKAKGRTKNLLVEHKTKYSRKKPTYWEIPFKYVEDYD